jgi:hypothetical protein
MEGIVVKAKATPLLVAVMVGYVLLLAMLLYFLPYPWNYAISSLVLFKGLIFWVVMRKASTLGSGRRIPPLR